MSADVNLLELEARLNAHRELLIDLLAAVMGDAPTSSSLDALRTDTVAADYEEDPGVLPDQAFAIENETASETRRILEAARARAAAR